MHIDEHLLYQFEAALNPQDINNSPIPATVLGFGEISAIFQIGTDTSAAYKRMPLFQDRPSAERFVRNYREYCRLLSEAGLTLPKEKTAIIQVPGRPVVCYIAQELLPPDCFGHRLIHVLETREIYLLIERITMEISKVFSFNRSSLPSLELALDGQISNWVFLGDDSQMIYIDTGTPLYRKDGVERLDPELFLQSAPGFLRWIIRKMFLEDVMNRYYDPRQVFMDLAGNLYKEQRADLVPLAVEIINNHVSGTMSPLSVKDVKRYYREDKLIWTIFLAFRRFDRWYKTGLLRKRYEFILPGKIKR